MEDIGMTDKQFNLFLRLLQASLKEIQAAETPEEKDIRIANLIDEIQTSIED